jgi:catechol 2,3-dioxygenase-like lactoylglutathione lyase family enzyme
VVAFVAASDLAESRRFYEVTLGLRLAADEEPIACVFDAKGRIGWYWR